MNNTPKIDPIPNKHKTQQSRGKRKLFIIAGISLIALSTIVIVVIVGGLLLRSRSNNDGKIRIEGVQPEISDELNKTLVYSSNGGEQSYYSPNIDVLIKYNVNEFNLSESTRSVFIDIPSLNLTERLNVNGRLYISTTGELNENPNKYHADYYKSLNDNVTVEDEKVDGEVSITKLNYEQKSYLENTPATEVNRLIISMRVNSDYVVIDFKYSSTFDISKYEESLINLIKNTQVKPTNISKDILLKIENPGISIKLDKTKWEIGSKRPDYGSATFLANKFETNPAYKFSVIGITLEGTFNTNSDINQLANRNLDADKKYQTGFELIDSPEEIEINGSKYITYTYKYTPSTTLGTLKRTVYIGYNTEKRYAIIIATREPFYSDEAARSEGGKELVDAVKTIEITSDSGSENTNSGVSLVDGSIVEFEKSAILGKLATVRIFNQKCVDIVVGNIPELPTISGKTYSDICTAGLGSGFYINSEGYVVTNSHVANANPIDIVSLSKSKGATDYFTAFMTDMVKYLETKQPGISSKLTAEQAQYLAFDGLVSYVKANKIKLNVRSNVNYVEREVFKYANSGTKIDLENKDNQFKAEIAATNNIDSQIAIALAKAKKDQNAGISIPDITVLKLSGASNPVTLGLADPATIISGQKIQVIGFPGAANNNELFSKEAAAISTLTNGTVSAVKPNTTNTFNLVQIDASTSHGNSGGPIINTNADVIAILTYGISKESSADFNAGVSVEELTKLMNANNIKANQSESTKFIHSALDKLAKEHYKGAIDDMKSAIALNSQVNSVLEPLIKISEGKIAEGADKTPALNIGGLELDGTALAIISIALVIIVCGVFLLIFVFIINLISKGRSNNKKFDPSTINLTQGTAQ